MKIARMRVGHRFEVGEFVWVKIGGRPQFRTRVLERAEGRLFYRIDWVSGGFNSLLNTVAVCESALLADDSGIPARATPCA